MEIFLVGGAVRDKLLDYPSTEQDWVVVGSSPEEMFEQGYQAVGKDFPVFLHPKTKEEFALARTERKTAPGYKGFQFNTSDDVTLEQDLYRRDLTINAIAQNKSGEIVDPYNGKLDVEQKKLRHVSDAFREDPVRVLRVARFAARYHHLGFTVAEETLVLMQQMVADGEVSHLVPERVWQEMEKAFKERNPEVFIEVLRTCGALAVIMPEVDNLFGVPQRKDYHPEIDTGIHTLLSLQQSVKLSDDTKVHFATLVHDLGKATTPLDVLPKHIGHEDRSLPLIKQLCQRLSVPNAYRDLALVVAEFHTHCHRAEELKPKTVYRVLKAIGAFKNEQRLEQFLIACTADARGRTGFEEEPYLQTQRFIKALIASNSIHSQALIAEGYEGRRLGEELEKRQIAAIKIC